MAKEKGLPFTITEEWYLNKFDKGCEMTGIPFDKSGSDTPWVAHIDRIIPELGYTKENCRLVCAIYNLAKKDWKDSDVLKMATHIIKPIQNIVYQPYVTVFTESNGNSENRIMKDVKHRAKQLQLEFNLTKEWFLSEFPHGCSVTGLELSNDGHSAFGVHIDRIVPENGYTIENCRLVCGCYNLAKKHWTDKDVFKMAKALLRYNI